MFAQPVQRKPVAQRLADLTGLKIKRGLRARKRAQIGYASGEIEAPASRRKIEVARRMMEP